MSESQIFGIVSQMFGVGLFGVSALREPGEGRLVASAARERLPDEVSR